MTHTFANNVLVLFRPLYYMPHHIFRCFQALVMDTRKGIMYLTDTHIPSLIRVETSNIVGEEVSTRSRKTTHAIETFTPTLYLGVCTFNEVHSIMASVSLCYMDDRNFIVKISPLTCATKTSQAAEYSCRIE